MPDATGIAELLQRFGAYGVAALAIIGMGGVFVFYRNAMSDHMEDLRGQVKMKDAAIAALQASKDAQAERLLVAADRVIAVQALLEKRIARPRVPKEGT